MALSFLQRLMAPELAGVLIGFRTGEKTQDGRMKSTKIYGPLSSAGRREKRKMTTQPFEIRPVPTSGDRIREINRQAEFMASRRVDREYAPAKWEYERGRMIEDLLAWEMRPR